MSKLIVFLGNPGTQYKNTRHNSGWLFSESLGLPDTWQTKFHALFQKDNDTIYLKPQTFMNESGRSVQEAASFFGIKPSDILVIHDDIEKKLGEILFEKGGGMHGHNGLRSIAQCLGTPDFCRMRIGVGRPEHQDVASFVLSKFAEDELIILEKNFEDSISAILNPFIKGRS